MRQNWLLYSVSSTLLVIEHLSVDSELLRYLIWNKVIRYHIVFCKRQIISSNRADRPF